MNKVVQQDLDLWEAWIEFDESHPENFGTLYVVGETDSSSSSPIFLLKKIAAQNKSLHLELIPQLEEKKKRNREVMFSEPLRSVDSYESVCIFFEGSVISKLEELEILI
jgi:hypothetical protein